MHRHDERHLVHGVEFFRTVERDCDDVRSRGREGDGGEGREEFGGADVRDVLAVTRIGQALPYVDPRRVFALGYSRGGMMALLAARKGAPHLAIATVGAPTDLRSARSVQRGGKIRAAWPTL